jgi:hypothetical protein
VNGVNGDLVHIGTNLEEALRELRHDTEDVILWADQLCINQDDNIEKSLQVQQMKSFYAQENHVIAWIGPAADGSAELFSLLKRTAQNVTECRYDQIYEDHEPVRILPSVSHSFKRFCEQSYWNRLWIMQEFTVGRHVKFSGEACLFRIWNCRPCQTPFSLFPPFKNTPDPHELTLRPTSRRSSYLACALCMELLHSVLYKANWASECSTKESLRADGSFFHLLISSSILDRDYNHPNCSDPRDRIFSLLGLANDGDFFHSIIDYAKSCEDVYEMTARKSSSFYRNHVWPC